MNDGNPLLCGDNQPPSIPPCQGGSLSPSPGAPPDKGAGGLGRAGKGFLPYNKNLTALARENRKNPTPTETKIWNEVLRMRQFADYKFLRQKPLAGYIVDFYCSELRLVIEIDGDSHTETVEYDAERTRILQSLGLAVIRYTNGEVISNIAGVFDDLCGKIEELTPLGPPLSGGKIGSAPPDKGAGGLGGRGVGCLKEVDANA